MGIFKADFYRFFVIGFAGGALLVLGTVGLGGTSAQIVPPAQAETTR